MQMRSSGFVSSLREISIYQNSRLDTLNHVHVKFVTLLHSWAAVTPTIYERDILSLTCALTVMKFREINGTVEIGSVTPTTGQQPKQWLPSDTPSSFQRVKHSILSPVFI